MLLNLDRDNGDIVDDLPIFKKKFGCKSEIIYNNELDNVKYEEYMNNFLQIEVDPENRKDQGLEKLFRLFLNFYCPQKKVRLEYLSHCFAQKSCTISECIISNTTYSTSFMVKVRLTIQITNSEGEVKTREEVRVIFLGKIPIMTKENNFIINGVLKTVVPQFQRSLGVFFSSELNKTTNSEIVKANVIPNRGSWLELEIDNKVLKPSLMFFRIDKKKKLPIIILLRAFGLSEKDIFTTFYESSKLQFVKNKWVIDFNMEGIAVLQMDLIDADTGKLLLKKGEVINDNLIRIFKKKGLKKIQVDLNYLVGKYIYTPIDNKYNLRPDLEESINHADILFRRGHQITEEDLDVLRNLTEVDIVSTDLGLYLINSFNHSLSLKITNRADALMEIFVIVSSSELSINKGAEEYFNNLFFDSKRYNLSVVGRVKINTRLGLDIDTNTCHLTREDIISLIQHLVKVADKEEKPDDIDHLGHKRIRTEAELFENQFYIGFTRFMKVFNDKINTADLASVDLLDLMSPRILMGPVSDFCATSPLVQCLDVANILAQIVHNRKFSALGPGGLDKERATAAVRNIHHSYAGRVCVVETPEGINSGLIRSPAICVRKNKFGFLETPFCKVRSGIVMKDVVVYLSADLEDNYKVAHPLDLQLDENNKILNSNVVCKYKGDIVKIPVSELDLVFSHSAQMLSVSATLIPGFANTTSVRTQMAVNMYRQALVSAMNTKQETPIFCTGYESKVIQNSQKVLTAKNDGEVTYVDNQKIIILKNTASKTVKKNVIGEEQYYSYPDVDIYYLSVYDRITKDLNNLQKPIVKLGDVVKKGAVLTNASGISDGQLSLGKRVLVAIISDGYGYEDGIIISQELCEIDKFKSFSTSMYTASAKNTPLGQEKITKDNPLSTDMLGRKYLDESGIITVGSLVQPNQILVSKVRHKLQVSASEKRLMKFLFTEYNAELDDSSTCATSYGIVIGVEIRERESVKHGNLRRVLIKNTKIKNFNRDKILMLSFVIKKYMGIFIDQIYQNNKNNDWSLELASDSESLVFNKNNVNELYNMDIAKIQAFNYSTHDNVDLPLEKKWKEIQSQLLENFNDINSDIQKSVETYTAGSDLLDEANTFVKIRVAQISDIEPGDKLAGRYGNKGVVSCIVPKENMPYIAETGESIQVIVNPLGIPARMNISQVIESHVGLASQRLSENIKKLLQDACIEGITETVYSLKPNLKENSNKFFIEEKLYKQEYKSDLQFEQKIENLRKYLLLIFENQEDDIKLIKQATVSQIVNLSLYYINNGIQMQTAIFNGVTHDDVKRILRIAGVCTSGQLALRDGRTGEKLASKCTVGWMYMLQLDHKASNKSHGRSTGPCTILTQQPTAGKSKKGGQKIGEMENWALWSHGASNMTKELSGSKSCDHERKSVIFNEIISNQGMIAPGGIEEGPSDSQSVKVVYEFLAALCLYIYPITKNDIKHQFENAENNSFEDLEAKFINLHNRFNKSLEDNGKIGDNKLKRDNDLNHMEKYRAEVPPAKQEEDSKCNKIGKDNKQNNSTDPNYLEDDNTIKSDMDKHILDQFARNISNMQLDDLEDDNPENDDSDDNLANDPENDDSQDDPEDEEDR